MEKVIYVLWRDPRVKKGAWSSLLRGKLADKLLELDVKGIQVNIADDDVKQAAPLLQCVTRPQMEAFVQIWLPSAIDGLRQAVDEVLESHTWRMAAYLVTESQPIINKRYTTKLGQRTPGFAQMAILRRPPRLCREMWLDLWQRAHTKVAVDIQDNFQYTQNLVVRSLGSDCPAYDAIVEECFETEAMANPHAFYGTGGDEDKLKQRYQLMMESCDRFIDRGKIDVVPTSQYVIATIN